MATHRSPDHTVKIPANIDHEDRVLGPFTARQAAILAIAGTACWLVFMATRTVLPLPVVAVVAVPVMAGAFAVAVVRRDGLYLDRLAAAAIRQHLTPRRLVPASESIAPPPVFLSPRVAAAARSLPGPLRLPVSGIDGRGVIDLGEHGRAAVVRCQTVSFALATPAEQEAMVAGFARVLNSLACPVQILVRAERLDLSAHVQRLRQAAPALAHPALEDAAHRHARFLEDLAASADLLWRLVLVVVRDTTAHSDGPGAGVLVARQADQIVRLLSIAGVSATVLDATSAREVLAAACDPTPTGSTWAEGPTS